ncbi:uncharacterized protein J3D65DRAFT_586495 [Phyllosticta citribraziliensis]|uniref:Cyclin N-terminal domain-containing protein n=1 Tax=Phyllosticta citribraziliensis TaxID=989973 RepID=A0ABR1LWL3_9PEZI
MQSPPSSDSEFEGSGSRRASIDSIDIDAYLDYANYEPLSNMPTPPLPAPASPSAAPLPKSPLRPNDDLRGYQHQSTLTPTKTACAAYLAKLTPSNASNRRPSTSTITAYLERTHLPLQVLGLAACILDALSMRFAKGWREALGSASGPDSASLPLPAASLPSPPASPPELLVLAALALAASYLDDSHVSLRHWAQHVSNCVFTARQLSATQRCLLVDLDYDLHSFTPEFVQDSIQDMQRAGVLMAKQAAASAPVAEKSRPAPLQLSGGSARWCNGITTPEPSPSISMTGAQLVA